MGRFKRHQSKNKGTITTVATSPTRYPSTRTERKRAPEISDRVRQMLAISSNPKKKHKSHKISSIVASLLKSVKVRGLYVSLENQYYIPNNLWVNDSTLSDVVLTSASHDIRIGINVRYKGWHDYYTDPYYSTLGKIILVNCLLTQKKTYTYWDKRIGREELLEYFAHDELEELKNEGNVTLYPNDLVFMMMFGAIFASIGLIFIIYTIAVLFNLYAAIIFAGIIAFLSFGKIEEV
jgi:hypothetical protein